VIAGITFELLAARIQAVDATRQAWQASNLVK
jgi:hypothetical protein